MGLALRRLDHIVLQVPSIASAHEELLGLGFEEAWPVGRSWPAGRTSGVALGGINLELLQPDVEPPGTPVLAELVFEPSAGADLARFGRIVEKIESDPERLAARGFPPETRAEPQRICTNAYPGAESRWPWFVCDYAPFLKERLGAGRFGRPFGEAVRVEVGPLRAVPKFVAMPEAADLGAFLTRLPALEGAEVVRAEEDAVVFGSGAQLRLGSLTIGR